MDADEAAHLPESSFLSRCRMTSWFSHAEQAKGGSRRGEERRGHPDATSQIARKDYLSPAAASPTGPIILPEEEGVLI